MKRIAALATITVLVAAAPARAQEPASRAPSRPPAATTAAPAVSGALAPSSPSRDYVIGPDDVLEVSYWKDRDASAQVAVRPDGCISLPLLNDVQASGLTPAELAARITSLASAFLEDPTVTVMVKQINSRKAYIVGEVIRPGAYALNGPVTVLQIIAMAGGPTEYASLADVAIVRTTAAGVVTRTFNYRNALKLKDLDQNILLLPGDTVIVR
jgi:polysaccharide export outer membrane protein